MTDSRRLATPPLASRRVRLEPFCYRHVRALHRIASSDDAIGLWPRRGREMDEHELERTLWEASRLQYAVIRRETSRVIGLVQGVHQDDRSRTVGLGFFMDAAVWNRGWPLEAIALFVNLLFEGKGFRKIYFHMSQSTLARVGTAVSSWLTCEAIFEDHTRSADGYEDWFMFALHHDQWDPSLLELLGAEPAGPAPASPGAS